MKFGIRTPSLKKSIAARTSIKRAIMPRMPKGYGFLRSPKKALYNAVYNKTTISVKDIFSKKSTKSKSKLNIDYSNEEFLPHVTVPNDIWKETCQTCSRRNTLDMKKLYRRLMTFIVLVTIIGFIFSTVAGYILIALLAMAAYFFKPTGSFFCNNCKLYFEIK